MLEGAPASDPWLWVAEGLEQLSVVNWGLVLGAAELGLLPGPLLEPVSGKHQCLPPD